MTLELAMLIALWCGQPINHSGFNGQTHITKAQVDECRQKIYSCRGASNVMLIKPECLGLK